MTRTASENRPPLRPLALSPHFLGLAPLDTWARILARARRRTPPAYLPRLALVFLTSTVATLVTLPERLVLAPWLRWRFHNGRAPGSGEVVVVLGYYRSGTTHLHYLLSCDRRFTTPRWRHAVAGQGFWLSWSVLRFLMVPFTPNTRMQDDVPFGPDWPAEDDFALATWSSASAIPWRYVFPSRGDLDNAWHFLSGLEQRELARFRRTISAFVWKLTALRPSRRVLLKTPSHTARLSELRRVFGDRLRVIHISREPEPVIRSNLRMMRRLESYGLERSLPITALRPRVVSQYLRTEEAFLSACERDPSIPVVRVRFRDLLADPLGQMRAAYEALALDWNDDVERRMARYLHAVAAHRTAGDEPEPELGEPDQAELDVCARLRDAFNHDRPSVEPTLLPGEPSPEKPALSGWLASPITASVSLGAWLALAHVTGNRLDSFVWVWGLLIGLATALAGGRGSTKLGLWAALWFLVVIAVSIYPLPEVAHGYTHEHRWYNVRDAYASINNDYLWILLGVVTAWRCASRRMVRPPGA